MATEIAIFPLREGHDPHDSSSQTAKVMKETFDTIAQQPGYQRLYWGTEVEDPTVFHLAVDWDSVDDHMSFTKSETYKAFSAKFGEVVDLSKAVIYHTHLSPHPPTAAICQPSTPITEMLVAYFPSTYSDADKAKFEQDALKLIAVMKENAPETYTGFSGGWIVEELPLPKSTTGEKGLAYASCVGWTSTQAHVDFRTTDACRDNIGLLRGAKELQGLSVVHVAGTIVS